VGLKTPQNPSKTAQNGSKWLKKGLKTTQNPNKPLKTAQNGSKRLILPTRSPKEPDSFTNALADKRIVLEMPFWVVKCTIIAPKKCKNGPPGCHFSCTKRASDKGL
jgi:hypothetical protein